MAFEVEEPALYLKTILYDETQYRLGYRKFYELCWNFEEETKEQVEPPNFGRLENESDASWTKRAEGEQTKFIEVLKSKHDRRDGDTKKKTLQRLVYGRNALTHVLADPGSSVNWEAEPLASESFESFEQRCYEQYIALVKGIIDSEAYDNAPANPYDPAHHSAILLLDGLKSSGRHGEYYARNIRESLAKAWANGEHRATYRHLAAGEKFTSWEKRQNMFGGTGVTIQGGLDDFEGCFNIYKELPEQLTSSLNEAEAKIFADNYKPASHEFRSFVGQVTGNLRKDNILQYLGKPYRELMEGVLGAVQTLEKTLTDVVCPKVSSDLSDHILKENAITIEVLKEGLDVAKGS